MSGADSDSRPTPQEILANNGCGQSEGYDGTQYAGSEQARDAVRELIDEFLNEERIISSRSIASAVNVDVRIQEIGKTLGAHVKGNTPNDWFTDVEVSIWRDTQPKKWRFVRVAGERQSHRSRRLRKPDLVREISNATGVEGVTYRTASRDGTEWEKAKLSVGWMRHIVVLVCERCGHTPAVVEEGSASELIEWSRKLTKSGAGDVLNRAAGIDDPGSSKEWNKSTLQELYKLLVEDADPSEVGADA